MSENTYEKINYPTESIQINQLDNSIDTFKKPLPAFRCNIFPRPFSLDNKNGFSGKKMERETKNLNQFESKSGEKMPKLEKIPCDIKCKYNQNDKQSFSNNSETSFQTKYLELRVNNFYELGNFSNIPDLDKYIYIVNKPCNLYYQHFLLCPIISKIFTQNKNLNNNIYLNRKRFLNQKSKIKKSCKYYSLKKSLKKKRHFINITNFKLENCEIEEMFINFIIPENFLTNFNVKDVIIKNIENNNINREKKPPSISLKDTEIFLNSLCKNVIINKDGECNTFNREYIEYKSFIIKVGEFFTIEKKPKNSLDYDENNFNCFNQNLSANRRRKSKGKNYPLKKNNKKLTAKIKNDIKINNQKNGEKKFGYLNQFKINNNSLVNFPFYPTLNIERIIYIKEILKSIIENEIIGFNEKVKFINDKRNEKYIINKRFEIIYQNKERNAQYILYLNEFHILYLIFFYYYQIKEELLSINQKYTSHRSKEEISNEKNKVEMLINKCNKIVKNIIK